MQFSADDNQVSADDDPIVVHVACITSSTFSVAPMPGPVVNYLPNRWAATTLVIAFAVDIVALLALSVILLTRRWSHR
jgi:hypothetical protein